MNGMRGSVNAHIWPAEHIVANTHQANIQHREIEIGVKTFSNFNLKTVIAIKRAGNAEPSATFAQNGAQDGIALGQRIRRQAVKAKELALASPMQFQQAVFAWPEGQASQHALTLVHAKSISMKVGEPDALRPARPQKCASPALAR